MPPIREALTRGPIRAVGWAPAAEDMGQYLGCIYTHSATLESLTGTASLSAAVNTNQSCPFPASLDC